MAALNSYDAILAALEAGQGQEVFFSKTAPIAQVAGAIHTSWAYTGYPGAGVWSGAGGAAAATMATCDSNTVGAIPLTSPTTASGQNPRIVSAGAMVNTAVGGTLMLVDRIADTGPLSTTLGNSCSITMPAGGWARYNNGVGVMAFLESLTGVPTANSNITLQYTNTDAASSRISGAAVAVAAAHRVIGTSGAFMALQGTDKGIKSIESISVTTATALNIAVVVCKPLLILPATTAYYYTERDMVIQTPKLPKLQVAADATACLQWIFFPGAATSPVLTGSLSMVTN